MNVEKQGVKKEYKQPSGAPFGTSRTEPFPEIKTCRKCGVLTIWKAGKLKICWHCGWEKVGIVKLFSKMIEKKIEHLETERGFLKKEKGLLPQGTLVYERCILAIAIWDLKISVLQALIGEE